MITSVHRANCQVETPLEADDIRKARYDTVNAQMTGQRDRINKREHGGMST